MAALVSSEADVMKNNALKILRIKHMCYFHICGITGRKGTAVACCMRARASEKYVMGNLIR